MTEHEQEAALRQEYYALMHAMQTGVAFDQAQGSDDGSPKHLRVGVNSALVDNGALAKLLVDKGIITPVELWTALRDGMQAEVERYKQRLSERHGAEVHLA